MILTKFLESKDWIRGLNFGIKTAVGMSNLKLFEGKQVRTYWDAKEEEWYFSIIDVIEILTKSRNPRDYWFKMKIRVQTDEGLELSTICRQLKLKAADDKMRETDCTTTQNLLRIIQSIPSPQAEPFKQWLAKVGYERIQEINDPGQSIDRARENWQKLGRSDKWIQQRMTLKLNSKSDLKGRKTRFTKTIRMA